MYCRCKFTIRLPILFLLLALPLPSRAQQPVSDPAQPPTLDQILTRVHENFAAYLSSIPNLFADEHLVSSMAAHDAGDGHVNNLNSTTDAIFRLTHSKPDSNDVHLNEDREIKSINRRPTPANQTLTLPELVTGAFGYGASFLSPELKRCFDYRLLPNRRLNKTTVMVVEYTQKPSLPADILCPISEQNTGRAYIDPASMQIVRIEQKRSHHELDTGIYSSLLDPGTGSIGGGSAASSQMTLTTGGQSTVVASDSAGMVAVPPGTLGTWSWSINYAPVVIDNKIFWLPMDIASTTTTNSGPLIVWIFNSKYSNYHLLTVTSKILPGYSDAPHQQ